MEHFNMSFSNKKITPVAAGILLALNLTPANSEIVLNFEDSTVAGVQGVDFFYTVCTDITDKAGREYRMCDPTNAALGGGNPLKKDTINGTEIWTFSDEGVFTGVTNTGTTGGVSPTNIITYGVPTADAGGAAGMDQGAVFFGNSFGFLAPFTGSGAGDTYGTGQMTIDALDQKITILFPVLEAQWSGTSFLLGETDAKGITFNGSLDNLIDDGGGAGIKSFTFKMYAEHTITEDEDKGTAGFANWTGQWYYVGAATAPDALFLFPAPPTATGGTLNVTAGTSAAGNLLGDGRASLANIVADYPADTGADLVNGISNLCSGNCFDFTVTGVAVGGNTVVTLPLASAIQVNPVLRKYNATDGWHNFDTSGGDIIETGPADTTPAAGTSNSCNDAGKVYTEGLNAGDACLRLTIKDGGSNDSDGIENGVVVDPSGIATSPPVPIVNTIPGESLDDAPGCSISSTPVNASNHAEWWIVAAFLSLIGLRRKLKQD